MSVTPGPWAIPSSIRSGRAAAVPSGKTVSRWPMRSARGPPLGPWNVPTTVLPRVAWAWISTWAPSRSRKAAVQAPTSSTPAFV